MTLLSETGRYQRKTNKKQICQDKLYVAKKKNEAFELLPYFIRSELNIQRSFFFSLLYNRKF